jgi:uncharacterized protein
MGWLLVLETQSNGCNYMLRNRIILFDILRGFAMLGVILINFHEMNLLPGQEGSFPESIFSSLIRDTFFNRSYLIFAFLFGCSLYLLGRNKLDSKSSTDFVNQIIMQRLRAILVFGLIQTLLIWWGTILIIYAIYGYLIYHITKTISSKLQIILFLFILVVFPLLMSDVTQFDEITITISWFPELNIIQSYYTKYNAIGLAKLNLFAWLYDFYGVSSHTDIGTIKQCIIYNCQIFGLIGIGYQMAKTNVLLTLRLLPNIIILGSIMFLYWLVISYGSQLALNKWFLKDLLFSICICLFIKLIINIKYIEYLLFPLAIIEKYSFSFYVLHMLISYTIFYVLGLYQNTSFYIQEYMAILTYCILFTMCYYLYKTKKSGPLEILLRKITYYKMNNVSSY